MNTKCPYSKDGICTVCNILKIRCEEEARFFLCYEYNKAKRAEQIRLKETLNQFNSFNTITLAQFAREQSG